MSDDFQPPPPKPAARLATRLTLTELEALAPEVRNELAKEHGLEIEINSRSERVRELLKTAGLMNEPTELLYDKVYDKTNPGYDRSYDRG